MDSYGIYNISIRLIIISIQSFFATFLIYFDFLIVIKRILRYRVFSTIKNARIHSKATQINTTTVFTIKLRAQTMSESTAFEVDFKSKDGASHKPEIADKLAHETLHHCSENELQSKLDKATERRKVLI